MFRVVGSENLVDPARSIVVSGTDLPNAHASERRNSICLSSAQFGSVGPLLCLLALAVSAQAQVPTLTNKWAVPIDSRSDSSPAISPDGSIYFGTWKGDLMALKPDGSRKWTFSVGREIRSSPALGGDGSVYFGCRDRRLYALDPNGQKKWEFKTGAWVDSSPALASDGSVYFGSWDHNFYALNSGGVQKWVFKTGGPVLSSPSISPEGIIYFGSNDRKFYAFKANGTKAGEYATGGAIISSPAIDKDGTVYITSVDGFFYALKPDATLKWRLNTAGITESSPVIGPDGMLYVGVNSKLWAIAADGQKKWEREVTNYQETYPLDTTPLVLADGYICVVSSYGLLSAVKESLPTKWIFILQGHGHSCPVVDSGGIVYIGGSVENLKLFLYALPVGESLAQSPWPKFRGNLQNTGATAR